MNPSPIRRLFAPLLKTFKKAQWRQIAAYCLMLSFIITPSVGVAMIYLPAGLICLGVTSGIVGYILGAE